MSFEGIRLRPSERHVVVVETECTNCLIVVGAYPPIKVEGEHTDGGWLTVERLTTDQQQNPWSLRARLRRAWRAWHRCPDSGVYAESDAEAAALVEAINRGRAVAFTDDPRGEGG